MLTKTKKIALLTTGLAGTLLATTIGGIALSSCTYNVTNGSNTVDSEGKLPFTTKIDWSNLEDVQKKLNIDENGLVYSDANRTTLIGSIPGLSISELEIPKTVKVISGYIDVTPIESTSGIPGAAGTTNSTKKGAFEGQTNLTSVKFLGQTQIISNNAFKGCSSLISVNLPSSLTRIEANAFENTGSISQINLNNVKYIGNSAFKQAFTNLPEKTVDISLNNAQHIEAQAFMGNTAIKSVNFSNNKTLSKLLDSAFENSSIPGTIDLSKATLLRSVGAKAFKGTTALDTVKFPSSLEALGTTAANAGVFQNSSIKSIDLSNTALTTLRQTTFSGSQLESFTLPETLRTLDVSAFASTKLTSLDLSNTKLTSLGNSSFQNVSNLTEIKFPTTLTTIGISAFEGTNLTSADLSNTQVTTIDQRAFFGLTNLTSVSLPNTLTTINNHAFQNSGITNFDMSNTKVNRIGVSAFEGSELAEIKFPHEDNLPGAPNTSTKITAISSSAFKGTKIKTIDLRHVNLTALNPSTFENCTELETVFIKSPDLEAVNSSNPTAIQKQITSVGSAVFKNASKLKKISHVIDGQEDKLTPDGIIVASPFLTSIGNEAFYNVVNIKVFDASLVKNVSTTGNFLATSLFAKDDAHAEQSQLEAVILPTALENYTGNNHYYLQPSAFQNNPKLTSVGTKSGLKFEEDTTAPEARVEDYLSKIKNPGFIAPPKLNVLGSYAFNNTAIEKVDMSRVIPFQNGSTLGSGGLFAPPGDPNAYPYGYYSFSSTLKLKKVILPTWLSIIQNGMFNNTPALEEINLNQLTNLAKVVPNANAGISKDTPALGSDNFNNVPNLKSISTVSNTPDTNEKQDSTTTATSLDLSSTKLIGLNSNTFTNLPSTVQEVKLPTTVTDVSFMASNSNVLTKEVKSENNNAPASTTRIPLTQMKFFAPNGDNQTKTKFESLMTTNNGTQTANTQFYKGDNVDLTHLKSLTSLEPGTFAENKDLKNLTLPAKAVNWKTSVLSGSTTENLVSRYLSAALSAQNKLELIQFSGFGVDSSNNADGSNIEDLDPTNDWDNKIKNNTQLWTTITTMMNSLGYIKGLDGDYSPKLGVVGIWRAPTTDSSTSATTPGSAKWINKDLTNDDVKPGSTKWFAGSTTGSTTTPPTNWETADTDLDTKKAESQTAYFKHNGIIWTWTQTKDTAGKLTITLSADPSTYPNVYKVKKDSLAAIATFRDQRWIKPNSGKAVEGTFGVPFQFNIAIKKASTN